VRRTETQGLRHGGRRCFGRGWFWPWVVLAVGGSDVVGRRGPHRCGVRGRNPVGLVGVGDHDAVVIVTADVRQVLDRARQAAGVRSEDGRVVREVSLDGAECRIVFADCAADGLEALVRAEVARAAEFGYALEWKTYGHDRLAGLTVRLLDAGFEPDAVEKVLVTSVDEASLAGFPVLDSPGVVIDRVHDERGLDGVAEVGRRSGRADAEAEVRALAAVLRAHPERVSVYVARVDGVAVACGRLHFTPGGEFAELAGGRTVPGSRGRGLFTALVGSRLREARARGCTRVFVDALPTSEPILLRRGFEVVTSTQPFTYTPAA
jgi:hypothetical protein